MLADASSLTTKALAFRVYDDNISDWATDAAMTGDWDGDGKSDVAAWTGLAWRTWHSDGLSGGQLSFTEYTHNLPAAVSGSAARIQGDFDGDGLDDLGVWDASATSSWQFVRAGGASGSAFPP